MDKRTTDVCYVNQDGELKCGQEITAYRHNFDETIVPAIQKAIAGISQQRLDLIMQLIQQVVDSPIDDACIGARADDTAGSVQVVLGQAPPVMLLFRYVALPGNIMAAYDIQQNKFDSARGALDHWSTLKPGC